MKKRSLRKKFERVLIFSVLLGLAGVPIFVFGLVCTNDNDCIPFGQVCRNISGNNICIFEGGPAVSVTVGRLEEAPIPPRGSGPEPPLPAEVIFKGMAYPNSLITLLKQGQVASTFLADNSGLFEKKLTGLIEGTYIFGIFAEDSEGRNSLTLNFTLNIFWGTRTTLSNIFIPPTISLSKTQIPKGQLLDVRGEVFPGSDVQLLISPGVITKTAKADSGGKWLYGLNTDELQERTYQVKAKGVLPSGQQSEFSEILSFRVGPLAPVPPKPPLPPVPPGPPACQGADLNFDNKVNLIDFSILLYWWNGILSGSSCVDVNDDSRIDIVDFSIMMYYWTG